MLEYAQGRQTSVQNNFTQFAHVSPESNVLRRECFAVLLCVCCPDSGTGDAAALWCQVSGWANTSSKELSEYDTSKGNVQNSPQENTGTRAHRCMSSNKFDKVPNSHEYSQPSRFHTHHETLHHRSSSTARAPAHPWLLLRPNPDLLVLVNLLDLHKPQLNGLAVVHASTRQGTPVPCLLHFR